MQHDGAVMMRVRGWRWRRCRSGSPYQPTSSWGPETSIGSGSKERKQLFRVCYSMSHRLNGRDIETKLVTLVFFAILTHLDPLFRCLCFCAYGFDFAEILFAYAKNSAVSLKKVYEGTHRYLYWNFKEV